MSHEATPTAWDADICSDCGFRIDQHRVLYGEPDDEGADRPDGSRDD